MRVHPKGHRVRHVVTGETGTVLSNTNVPYHGYRVQVDVDPTEWKNSVIGPPSNVTASWESWQVETLRAEFLAPEEVAIIADLLSWRSAEAYNTHDWRDVAASALSKVQSLTDGAGLYLSKDNPYELEEEE